jgi:NAD(P)-dependent dehydrogenase (short-subunit alcohol dehydrogenase family)
VTATWNGTVVVTGAANGIGRAVAQRLHFDGRTVIGVDRVGRYEAPFAMETLDLSQLDMIAPRLREIEETYGPLTALVNVAGIYERIDPAAFSAEAYRRVLTVDLDAPILMAVAAAEIMASRGYGRIVNVTSIHGEFGERGGLAYDVAKGGLNQATRTLALEYADRGVLCNAVAPGFVDTEMAMVGGVLESTTDSFRQIYVDAGKLPLGRAGTPDDIAGLVAWLCSSDNTYVTAQVIRVDGGLTATF